MGFDCFGEVKGIEKKNEILDLGSDSIQMIRIRGMGFCSLHLHLQSLLGSFFV